MVLWSFAFLPIYVHVHIHSPNRQDPRHLLYGLSLPLLTILVPMRYNRAFRSFDSMVVPVFGRIVTTFQAFLTQYRNGARQIESAGLQVCKRCTPPPQATKCFISSSFAFLPICCASVAFFAVVINFSRLAFSCFELYHTVRYRSVR